MRGPLGWVRDRIMWKVMERVFGKVMLPGLNALRADVGLAPYRSPLDQFDPPGAVIALTSEPLEYPRTDLPAHIHLVGTQPWDAPAARPAYLDEPGDPWVLVTCSTEYQGDEELARVAVEALRDEPVRVLLTLADAYGEATIPAADNVRMERFVPHGQVLPHTDVVVCHGGMGIVTKAASPAYRLSWCRSAATNPRWRGASWRVVPGCPSKPRASTRTRCARRSARRAR